MTEPLLETKLYLPKLRPDVVARPRLSERLCRGAESKLTLISAPAGFGKTTLLTEWLAATPERAVACFHWTRRTADPATFWTYVISALQTVVPGVGASALPLLQSADSPIEPVLTIVINELGAVPHDVAIVLDDYHVVESPDIEEGMIFLLEHLPSQVHVVIATRADPRLPLARLRARGELVEVRAADLRFSPRRSSDVPQRGGRSRLDRRERRNLRRAHRGLDRGAAARRTINARTSGRRGVHRRLRGQRSVHR